MTEWLKLALTVLASCLASSGFWAFVQSRKERKDMRTKMILGLAHDRIISLGTMYIEQGFVGHSDYENLIDYLYEPYKKLGGNGHAERIVKEVMKLPLKKVPYDDE